MNSPAALYLSRHSAHLQTAAMTGPLYTYAGSVVVKLNKSLSCAVAATFTGQTSVAPAVVAFSRASARWSMQNRWSMLSYRRDTACFARDMRRYGTMHEDATMKSQHRAEGVKLDKETPVEVAVQLCCNELSREYDKSTERLVGWLRSNWYMTIGDLACITVEEATHLNIPLRMVNWMKDAVELPEDIVEATASAKQETSTCSDEGVEGAGLSTAADCLQSNTDLCLPFSTPPPTARKPARLTKRKVQRPYALKESECCDRLNKEIGDFFRFCTTKSFRRQTKTISHTSAAQYCKLVRRMLGWMHHYQNVSLETLSIRDLVPSSDRAGAEKAFDFLTWLEIERNCAPRTLVLQAAAILVLGQYLYHRESHASPGEGDQPYEDILVVKELRRLANQAQEGKNSLAYVSDIEKKWIDWPDYLQLVNVSEKKYRHVVKMHEDGGAKLSAVALSLQAYLILGILACIPDRQRTIRELKYGSTLIKTPDDTWIIRHSAQDYKTGNSYGDRPDLIISPYFYADLEAWLYQYRAALSPRHDYVFTAPRGGTFTDSHFTNYFSAICYKLAGKRMNPHLVRDSIVTFLRKGDHSQSTLESLALYMGHSMAMQRDTYDRRTKKEKAQPAAELLSKQLLKTFHE